MSILLFKKPKTNIQGYHGYLAGARRTSLIAFLRIHYQFWFVNPAKLRDLTKNLGLEQAGGKLQPLFDPADQPWKAGKQGQQDPIFSGTLSHEGTSILTEYRVYLSCR
jgi:hypothetical protein